MLPVVQFLKTIVRHCVFNWLVGVGPSSVLVTLGWEWKICLFIFNAFMFLFFFFLNYAFLFKTIMPRYVSSVFSYYIYAVEFVVLGLKKGMSDLWIPWKLIS